MFHDLDKSLKKLLERELPHVVSPDNIRFETPDNEFAPALPAVNLFLFDVQENRELRSNEWLIDRRPDGTATRKRAPTRVNCGYLVTAWAKDVETEHRLLGDVIKALAPYATIPADVLCDGLRNQEPPLPAITWQAHGVENAAEFWRALLGKPRAALRYTVTIGFEAHKPEEVRLVKEKVLDIQVRKGVAP
jgi:hypothetical protein